MSELDMMREKAAERVDTWSTGDNVTPISPATKQGAKPTVEQQIGSYFDKLVFDDQDAPLVEPKWLVRNTVAEGGLVFLGGQSTAGKSFMVMELARCLMTGSAFFGRLIEKKVGVVLFAPEGQETIVARMAAMRRHFDIKGSLPFAFLGELPSLETDEGRAVVVGLLVKAHKVFMERFGVPLGAVPIDTLAAAFEIADQNDNSEAAKRIRQMKQVRDEVTKTIGHPVTLLPVHHYGKTLENGLTGGHGWFAGADQVLSILVNKDGLTGEAEPERQIHLAKNRNGSEGPISVFELTYQGLGYRDDGSEWGSLVVNAKLDKPVTKIVKTEKQSKPTRVMDEAFAEALAMHGESRKVFQGTGPTVRAVKIVPHVREAFFARYPTGVDDPDKSKEQNEAARYEAKKKAFQRAIGSLGGNYVTETSDGVEWMWSSRGDKRDKGDKS